MGDLLIFWDEEKPISSALENLEKKSYMLDPLHFDGLKFQLCYTANGFKLQFFAIFNSIGNSILSQIKQLSQKLNVDDT